VLTVAEYSVKPKILKDTKAIDDFKDFLNALGCSIEAIDLNIAEFSAEIRAKYTHIKAFDAIQIATAILSGCTKFVTNDKQLKQIEELEIVIIAEL
jgi:predicted nucleic acid-binding protein